MTHESPDAAKIEELVIVIPLNVMPFYEALARMGVAFKFEPGFFGKRDGICVYQNGEIIAASCIMDREQVPEMLANLIMGYGHLVTPTTATRQ